jgi:hypothetical protein
MCSAIGYPVAEQPAYTRHEIDYPACVLSLAVTGCSSINCNATSFTPYEYSVSGKWLELLKEIAPRVTQAAVIRDDTSPNAERLLALLDSLRFGYSNIRKYSVVQFQQCFALSPSLPAPDCEFDPVSQQKSSRAT